MAAADVPIVFAVLVPVLSGRALSTELGYVACVKPWCGCSFAPEDNKAPWWDAVTVGASGGAAAGGDAGAWADLIAENSRLFGQSSPSSHKLLTPQRVPELPDHGERLYPPPRRHFRFRNAWSAAFWSGEGITSTDWIADNSRNTRRG
ncbi:MAG: hypothetical protein LBT97_02290 [Planctomycetota bacterium]|nr:hypothetical protein [Planctomycetota bacterium]